MKFFSGKKDNASVLQLYNTSRYRTILVSIYQICGSNKLNADEKILNSTDYCVSISKHVSYML